LHQTLKKEEHKQVILTTHSPYFVNPTEDHTTIVRLERKDNITTPKAFRAEKCKFEEKELDNLKMLLKMDTALCEVFFGGYPIIVEGDTEYLSFLEFDATKASNLKESIFKLQSKEGSSEEETTFL